MAIVMGSALPYGDAGIGFYASFWRRAGAALIDDVILVLPFAGLTVFTAVSGGSSSVLGSDVLWIAVAVLYDLHFLSTPIRKGATPGRRALGIRVIDGDGNVPAPHAVLVRNIPTLLTLPLLYLPDPWYLLTVAYWIFVVVDLGRTFTDGRRQAWHDRWAGTYVVHGAALARYLDTGQPRPA